MLHIVDAPKWQLLGGFLGVIVISTIVLTIPHLGVTLVFLSIISGQIFISMIIDHFGFLDVPKIPMDWRRIFGFIMMVIGLAFISRSIY